MIKEIITLIINEAQTRQGAPLPYKLEKVFIEIGTVIDALKTQLFCIENMKMSEDWKEEMRVIVLTSHKT